MQDFKGRAKGGLLRRTVTFLPQEEIKIAAGRDKNSPAGKRVCFVDKAPLSPFFRNPAFGCGDFRLDERRKPRTYLGCLSRRAGIWRR